MNIITRLSFLSMIVLYVFASCDLSSLGLNRSRQYSIISPEDNIKQIPHADFFYVNVKSAYYTGAKDGFNPLDFAIYARDEGIDTDCKIAFDEDNTTEDLYCRLDVMEGDLWVHEINLEYNAPPGMCHYLGFQTHWHYNYESGYGPPYVAQKETGRATENNQPVIIYEGCTREPIKKYTSEDATCETKNSSSQDPSECDTKTECETATSACHRTWITDDSKCSIPTCEIAANCRAINHNCHKTRWDADKEACYHVREDDSISGFEITSCKDGTLPDKGMANCLDKTHPCHAGIWKGKAISVCPGNSFVRGTQNEDSSKACQYIRTKDDKEINCCVSGTYSDSNGSFTGYKLYKDGAEEGENNEWGGDMKDCIGGLGKINWEVHDKYGFPGRVITESGSKGVIAEYKLPPLIDKTNHDQVSFPIANHINELEDDYVADNLPYFYNSPNEPDKQSLKTGYPYITWSCLDQAYEVRHRIHLQIREWNTLEEFQSFKDGGNGDPDIGSENPLERDEGDSCDYQNRHGIDLNFGRCNDLADADNWLNTYPQIDYE